MVCFLPELDADGAMPDVRQRIRIQCEGAAEGDARTVYVDLSPPGENKFDEWAPLLAPQQNEEPAAFRRRLAEPVCRTAAWRIALESEERPVVIHPGADVSSELAAVLIDYLRGLVS